MEKRTMMPQSREQLKTTVTVDTTKPVMGDMMTRMFRPLARHRFVATIAIRTVQRKTVAADVMSVKAAAVIVMEGTRNVLDAKKTSRLITVPLGMIGLMVTEGTTIAARKTIDRVAAAAIMVTREGEEISVKGSAAGVEIETVIATGDKLCWLFH